MKKRINLRFSLAWRFVNVLSLSHMKLTDVINRLEAHTTSEDVFLRIDDEALAISNVFVVHHNHVTHIEIEAFHNFEHSMMTRTDVLNALKAHIERAMLVSDNVIVMTREIDVDNESNEIYISDDVHIRFAFNEV